MAATDGTAQGLLEFLEWAGSRGELNPTTAQAIGTASRKILSIEGDLDSINMTALDVDSILDRFQNLHRTDYSESSMSTYLSRFRTAVAMYAAWLDKRPDWKSLGPSAKKAKPRQEADARKTSRIPRPGVNPFAPEKPAPVVEDATSPVYTIEMIAYEVPLRPDVKVRLVLPVDLTTRDAERITNFVRSLAFDTADPKAITRGVGG